MGEERRDCGIFSANYIHPPAPLPCHELLRLHALHTALGSRPPAHMLPLMLPDYSAAANQYSQALGMGTPLELLHRVFTRIVCTRVRHGSHITWFGEVLTRACRISQYVYAAATSPLFNNKTSGATVVWLTFIGSNTLSEENGPLMYCLTGVNTLVTEGEGQRRLELLQNNTALVKTESEIDLPF